MTNKQNIPLIIGGILSIVASLTHIVIIIGGAEWYRFFGAGEELATMAEQGSWLPATITFAIAVVLFLWGLYAFSGAKLIRELPFLKIALLIISSIYVIRGIAVIPAYFVAPETIDNFLIWSSIICIGYGALYTIGTVRVYRALAQ